MEKYLICIIGPTAIGKTSKSIELAKKFETGIISADSRQFYKEMSIGTAVPSVEELAAVPHHFIQHISVEDDYAVGDFEKQALQKLKRLFQKKQVIFMVGGSGLFVDAVTQGLDAFPKVIPGLREKLNNQLEQEGLTSLQNQLKALDPDYAKKIDMKNPRRIIRALEICISSGKPFSSFLNQPKPERFFKTIKIGLEAPREILYDRINQRVDQMIENGLVEEAKKLYPQRHNKPLNTIGYKELYAHFEEEYNLDFAIAEIKKNTRRFAKRQMTWFRKDQTIKWFPYDRPSDEIIEYIHQKIE